METEHLIPLSQVSFRFNLLNLALLEALKNEEIIFETDESKNKSKATSVKSKTKKNNERSIKKKTIKEKL